MIYRKYILFRKKEQEFNLLSQPNSATPLLAPDYLDLKKASTLKSTIELPLLIGGQCLLLPMATRIASKMQSRFTTQPPLTLLWFTTACFFLKFNLLISRILS